jgi:uncharacterized protein YjdB
MSITCFTSRTLGLMLVLAPLAVGRAAAQGLLPTSRVTAVRINPAGSPATKIITVPVGRTTNFPVELALSDGTVRPWGAPVPNVDTQGRMSSDAPAVARASVDHGMLSILATSPGSATIRVIVGFQDDFVRLTVIPRDTSAGAYAPPTSVAPPPDTASTLPAGTPPSSAAPTTAAPDVTPCVATTVQPLSVLLGVQQKAKLVATVRGASGELLTGRPITWMSSDPTIVRVQDGNLVAGTKVGTAIVSAACQGGMPGAATVTVSTTP